MSSTPAANTQSKRRKFLPYSTPPSQRPMLPFTISDDKLDLPSSATRERHVADEIQTQLLQVGMRVRKAVNEGYRRSSMRIAVYAGPATCPSTPSAQPTSTTRELTPYAYSEPAMHRIGGMAAQFSTDRYEQTASRPQTLWNYSTANKRVLDDEDSDSDESTGWHPRTPSRQQPPGLAFPTECFLSNFTWDVDETDFQTQDFTPPHQMPRKFARLRRRNNANGVLGQVTNLSALTPLFQKETGFKHVQTSDLDFADAPFLQNREDVDMDWT